MQIFTFNSLIEPLRESNQHFEMGQIFVNTIGFFVSFFGKYQNMTILKILIIYICSTTCTIDFK